MAVLELCDPNVRRIRKGSPLLKNTKILGRGAFCCVMQGAKNTRVLKLTADSTHVAYLVDKDSPSGVFRPKVFHNHGILGKTVMGCELHLLEVERLYPIAKGSVNRTVAEVLIDCCYFREQTLRKNLRKIYPNYEVLIDFVKRLRKFSRIFGCHLDFHHENFMQRSNGQLVFSDPVLDEEGLRLKSYSLWTKKYRSPISYI